MLTQTDNVRDQVTATQLKTAHDNISVYEPFLHKCYQSEREFRSKTGNIKLLHLNKT